MSCRPSSWLVRVAAPLCVLTLVTAVACGDDSSDPIDVTGACDRLEDLSNAYLEARGARSDQEFAGAVEQPRHAFLEAAETSGDDQLADLADTYDDAFSTAYFNRTEPDDEQAVDDANRALDHSAARCVELGADNDFPQDP